MSKEREQLVTFVSVTSKLVVFTIFGSLLLVLLVPVIMGLAVILGVRSLFALAASVAAAVVIRAIVRWVGRRDDPRFANRPE